MQTEQTDKEHLAELIERLEQAVQADDAATAYAILEGTGQEDTALLVDRLDEGQRTRLFGLLTPEQSADVLRQCYHTQGFSIIEQLEPMTAAPILENLDSDERADILGELDVADCNAILEVLPQETAAEVRQFIAYPEGTAGSLMYSEFLAFRETQTVQQILDDLLRKRDEYAEYGVQYAYVLDDANRLRGVLPIRNLLFADKSARASQVMIPEPITVRVEARLDDLETLIERHQFVGFPVTDAEERLMGIVDREGILEARQEEATGDFLKIQGLLGKEELRSMPLYLRSRRRLSWLSINIVLNLIAASIIAFHQNTLKEVIALAVFLPIISDMSGCSGNQAVAVSMRELSLGMVRPKEVWRVFTKEFQVGIINGSALGLLLGTIAWIWFGNGWLGIVVALALALNTVVAVIIGGSVPLLLRGMGQDPALASGPILTT
ncbi:MAG: magnesium transporter, partial [Opitutales bacterium]